MILDRIGLGFYRLIKVEDGYCEVYIKPEVHNLQPPCVSTNFLSLIVKWLTEANQHHSSQG